MTSHVCLRGLDVTLRQSIETTEQYINVRVGESLLSLGMTTRGDIKGVLKYAKYEQALADRHVLRSYLT